MPKNEKEKELDAFYRIENISSATECTGLTPAAPQSLEEAESAAELMAIHSPPSATAPSPSNAPAAHRDTGRMACMAGRIEARCAISPPSKLHRSTRPRMPAACRRYGER